MIIVGELINGSRKPIANALAQRDAKAILQVAQQQIQAGAHLLDVNAGTGPDREGDDLVWLVEVVLSELDVPLCIDSPDVEAMEKGLARAGQRATMINSITAEKNRLRSFLPLIKAYGTQVIALCMDEGGVPKSPSDRYRIAARLLELLTAEGIAAEKIFLDPIVCPIGVGHHAGQVALETVRLIKEKIPQARTICGLSNVSFGLPQRRLLNRSYLSLMMAVGLDAAILDPTDAPLMASLMATQVLLGRDEHCLDYIAAERRGRLISGCEESTWPKPRS